MPVMPRPYLPYQLRQRQSIIPDYKREVSYSIFDDVSNGDENNQNDETYEFELE